MKRGLDATVAERRRQLRFDSDFTFTNRLRFCALLTSRGHMARFKDDDAALQGVVDLDSGEHYVIEAEKLFPVSQIASLS